MKPVSPRFNPSGIRPSTPGVTMALPLPPTGGLEITKLCHSGYFIPGFVGEVVKRVHGGSLWES